MTGLLDATIALNGRVVLSGVSFTPSAGALTVLCGPNGAGKSTLLRALAGLLPGVPPADPRRLAYLPQDPRCAWALTVRQVVALGRLPHRDDAAGPVQRAIAACGLGALAEARIDRVSGGEARRAMLARALATEAQTLLLDEPTADLDPRAGHQVMRLLRDVAQAGAAVVAVLHDIDLAIRYADRIVVVRNGQIDADLPAAQALPAVAAAFGLPFGTDPTPRLLPPA